MESRPQNFLFNGLDGFAGFRSGQTYQLTPDHWDDGSGTVTVEVPHAPTAGGGSLMRSSEKNSGRRLHKAI